jgi:putative membrane protein
MDIMRNRADLTSVMLLTGLLVAASAVAQSGASPTGTSGGAASTQGSATDTSTAKPMKATADTRSGSSSLKATDKTFVRKAAEGGMAEVELGKLAASKASDPEVKSFGQKMVDDHSKANDKLKQVAGQKGVDLPNGMSAKDKALEAKLDKLSGADFDRTYMKEMLKDHQKDVAEFRKEAKRAAADADVKSFASDTLPTLEEHLKMAQDVSKKVGVSTASGTSHSRHSRASRKSAAGSSGR